MKKLLLAFMVLLSSVCYSQKEVIVKGGTLLLTNVLDSTTIYILQAGQSNTSVQDTVLGGFVITIDSAIEALSLGRQWQIANPASNNICFSDLAVTATRNNLMWAACKNYRKRYPLTKFRMLSHAIGGFGSPYLTPKTTGNGEYVSSNVILDSIISKLSSIPSGSKLSMFIYTGSEGDLVNNNLQYLLGNITEIYDTLAHHPKCDSNLLMIITYPVNNLTNGTKLSNVWDSIYYKINNMGTRRIIAVPGNYPGFDNVHFNNEAIEAYSRQVAAAWEIGAGFGEKRPDTVPVKSTGTYDYSNKKLLVNAATPLATGFPLEVQNTSAGLFAALRSDGNQRGAAINGQTSVTEWISTRGGVSKVVWQAGDSLIWKGTDSTVLNPPMTIYSHSVNIDQQLKISALTFSTSPLRVNGGLIGITTSVAGDQLTLGSTGASSTNKVGINFKLGSVTGIAGSVGSPAGYLYIEHDGAGGRAVLGTNPAFSGAVDALYAQNGRIGIGSGNNTPTSTLTTNSFATAYVAKSTSYTATISDNVIEVTATGQTITLPTAVGIQGRHYTIKLTASGTGTVATTSSQTIDGSTTYSLSAQYKYVTVQSNNANWIIIANN